MEGVAGEGEQPQLGQNVPLLSGLLLTPTLEEGGGPGERDRGRRGGAKGQPRSFCLRLQVRPELGEGERLSAACEIGF